MATEKHPDSLLELMKIAEEKGLADAEKKRMMGQYLSRKTREKAIPFSGTFELTPLCNLSCKMCYVHLRPEQMGDRKLLDAAQWKQLITHAAEAGMMRAALTGGECLTHPDFDEIYLHLQSLGIETAVLTNGLLLTEERIRFFQEHPVSLIQVTLYGSDDEEYWQVCGVRCFQRVINNIQAAHTSGLPISIAITPNRFLPDKGENLVRYAASMNIPYSINSSLFSPHPDTGRQGQLVDLEIEDYVRLYSLRAELNGSPCTPVDPCQLPSAAESSDQKKCGLLCSAGMNAFTIGWDGYMMPCSSLYQIQEAPLRIGFQAAWQRIHEAAVHYPIPAECGDCEFNTVCPACVAVHQQDAPPGHASPRQCLRARKLAQAGLVQPI